MERRWRNSQWWLQRLLHKSLVLGALQYRGTANLVTPPFVSGKIALGSRLRKLHILSIQGKPLLRSHTPLRSCDNKYTNGRAGGGEAGEGARKRREGEEEEEERKTRMGRIMMMMIMMQMTMTMRTTTTTMMTTMMIWMIYLIWKRQINI